jgi:superfamily II DNA or RNA helicase
VKQYSLFDPAPVVVTPPVEDLGGKLRPYQTDVLDRGRKHIGRGRKRGIIQIDTGGGKSYVAGEIARCALLKGSRVLILADRRKLVTQLGKALQAFKVPYGVIMSDSTSAPWLPCITASRDTLHAWKKRELTMPDPFQIIIIDECFPAGTIVDGRPIESFRIGDTVSNFDEHSKVIGHGIVKSVFKTTAPTQMVEITAGSNRVTATVGHPFLTSRGWVNASELKAGDDVFGLFETLPCQDGVAAVVPREGEAGLLLGQMPSDRPLSQCQQGHERKAETGVCPTDDNQKPDAVEINQDEGVGINEEDRPQTADPRRQRQRFDDAGVASIRSNWPEAVRSEHASTPATRDAESLQDRPCLPGPEAGNRGGWRESQQPESKGCRPSEGSLLGKHRVDSVTILERGRDGSFGGMCPDGSVYNLEVEGCPTYIANGFAVHNCHKAPGYVYQELLSLWPDAVVIGMTATPARGDGRRLDGTFQWLECAVPITQLIREGWLVPSEIYWPKELAKQRKVGKGKREVAGDPVSHWVRHAEGMATIGFCNSINQSVKYRDLFIKAGIAAEHIDADTPDKERDRIYERLAERETLVLFSVGLLIEGIDIAEVSAAIMLKKFGSIVEWRQACGRTKRPCPAINKTKSIILDHTGASGIHGSPDEEIEWSLDPNSTVSQRRKEKLKNENINPIVCRTCGGMYSGKSQCPFCGADAPKMKKSSLQQEADERDEILSRRDMDDESTEWAMKENYHTTYKKIVAIAANRNLTYKAVVALFRKQTGMWPSDAGITEPPRELWGEKANILFPNYTAKKAKRP